MARDAAKRAEWRKQCRERALQLKRARWQINREAELAKQRDFRQANPEVVRSWRRTGYEKNREKCLKRAKRNYPNRTESQIASSRSRARAWTRNNPDRVSARCKQWAKDNPHRVRAAVGCRRAAEASRTPCWAELELIELVYAEALHRGLQVDHIIPLRGRTVSGLHVLTNLQLLTKSENAAKRNTYPYPPRINP